MIFTEQKNRLKASIVSGLVALIIASFPIHSQSNIRLSGQVRDAESGFPLPDVAVQVQQTTYGAYTDEEGFFFIENIPPGSYSLQFTRLGYQTRTIPNVEIKADFSQRLIIDLQAEPLRADSIVVFADAVTSAAGLEGEKTVIAGADLDRYRQLGLSQLLQQVAGVQVESGGSSGGRSSVRIHGGRSNQVLVLLDGQRLNNPQTGEVDLSQIPLQQIERIEVIRQGNSALYGSNAFDGIIAFHTKRILQTSTYSLQSQAGSFSSYMGGVSSGFAIGNTGGLLNYQQDYSRQDFAYEYEGSTFNRQNAWYRNRKFFGKAGFESSRYRVNFLYNHRDGNRGLPCAFFNECGEVSAAMQETMQALQMNQRWIFSSKGYLEGLIAYHRLQQHFNNENDAVRINRYKTEQINRTVETNVTARFAMGSFSDIRLGGQYFNEMMEQENLLYPQLSIGEKSRESRAAFGGFEFVLPRLPLLWRAAKFRSAIRYEEYFSQPGRWYPNLGLSVVPSFWKALRISTGWYGAVRYPDFNSLFWKGDSRARGNPDLLPERKTAWNATLSFKTNETYLPEAYLHYYSEKITDLIFWHRSFNGVWEPRNEADAHKRGVDVELSQNIIPDHIRVRSAYTFINAINKVDEPNRYDKRIVFIPQHTMNNSLWIGWENWQIQLIYRRVSQRETVPANSSGAQLSAYAIWDISAGYKHRFGKLTLDIGLALKNLTDTDYQLLYGYPMPGREISLSLSLSFQGE